MVGRKYLNKKVELDGIKFDSKLEAKRYSELKLLEKEGLISFLTLQEKFILQEKFRYRGKSIREIAYVCDFRYFDNRTKETVVEDTKGFVTKEYALKRKMFMFKYPHILFVEVKK